MKFLELRIRKLNKRLLFFFPILMLLVFIDQGHYAYADGNDLNITAIYINNESITDKSIRVIYNSPVLVNTYIDSNNQTYFLWEIDTSINKIIPVSNDGYYSINGNIYLSFNYPSTASVYSVSIENVNTDSGHSIVNSVNAFSSPNRYIRAGFSILGYNVPINKNLWYNLGNFKIKITTTDNNKPMVSCTMYQTSGLYINSGISQQQLVTNAINNSNSATDIATILTQAREINIDLDSIIRLFGINNTYLDDISGYAYEIYNILNAQYPTSASEALSDAQDNLESINQDIIDYSPPTVSDQQIISNGSSAYMSMQLEGDTDNLFWYLNWGVILSLVTLIFSLAIISYIIYGKYS